VSIQTILRIINEAQIKDDDKENVKADLNSSLLESSSLLTSKVVSKRSTKLEKCKSKIYIADLKIRIEKLVAKH
jgi:hypothetical protein